MPTLSAGDIGAVVKLKDTQTGNTLCGAKKPVSLPKVEYPKPNIHASLKSSVKGEEDKIASGLAALHHEDPTFLYMVDSELRQTIVSAQGELHLEVIADHLRRRYNVHVELIEPRVRYRETIKARGDSKYRHKKQTGGAGQFAEVWMRIEPKPRDTGVEFTHSLVGQNVDRVFVPSVEKGVMKACEEGILAGYRVVDVKIDFYDGKMHPVDSKDIAFQIAGYFAFKEAFMAGHGLSARTDPHGRDPDPRGLHGQGHGRPVQPARQDPGHGHGRRLPGDQGPCPGQGTLSLLKHTAIADRRARGPCGVLQPLRGNAARGGSTRSSRKARKPNRPRPPSRTELPRLGLFFELLAVPLLVVRGLVGIPGARGRRVRGPLWPRVRLSVGPSR